MKYDGITAFFEISDVNVFNEMSFVNLWMDLMDDLLSFEMIPRTPTSSGMKLTRKPASLRSLMSGEYLFVFISLEICNRSSQGTVSSMRVIDGFSHGGLLMMVISGFSEVTRISGGIVPPPVVCPLMSAYTSRFSLSMLLRISFMTSLCQ